MSTELTKAILIDAIAGRGFISMKEADHYTKIGLAKYTGNQWNEYWRWDRSALARLDFDLLFQIYQNDKE